MNTCLNSVQSYRNETFRKTIWGMHCAAAALLILLFSTSLGAQTSADSVRVNALNSEAGATSLYTLEFTLADTLYPDAEVEVVFPPGFDVSKVTIAGSKAVNGGFEVNVAGQTVTVKRKGTGAVKLPGEKVDVMFAVVTNPPNPDSNHKINATIKRTQNTARTKQLNGSILISAKKVQ